MDSKKVINRIMLERGVDYAWMADRLGMKTQSFRNKISRGNYGFIDFVEMMNILECDVQVVTRDSHKIFD